MFTQANPTYPPAKMERLEVQYVGSRQLRIELYGRFDTKETEIGLLPLVEESIWLISRERKVHLEARKLDPESNFYVDRLAVAPNQDFIFGARKVCSGTSEMYMWVRQKNGTYKLHRETVNAWVARRTSRTPELNFVRLLEWKKGGNTVVLACDFTRDRKSPWHRVEIDLVQGKFSRYTKLGEEWKSLI
jgi:hypothetical protein